MKSNRGSPEFVEVLFDENGHPFKVRSAKTPPLGNEKISSNQICLNPKPAIVPTLVVNKDLIEKMLIFVSKNIESLRAEMRQSNHSFQQALENMKMNDLTQVNSLVLSSAQPLKEKIENLQRQMSLQNEFIQTINKKLDTLGIYFNELSARMGQLKADPAIAERMEDMSVRISSMGKEIAETKMYELSTTQNIKSFAEKMLILIQELQKHASVEAEFLERFGSIEEELKSMYEYSVQSNEQTQQKISRIEEKLNDFSNIRNEFESLKNHVSYSVNELAENQVQMKADMLVSQEQVSKAAVNDAVLKIQKMLAKKKKRIIKPQRAKVIRFLRKNFKIKPFSKVLVITEKRNSVFGKTLHESTRKLSRRSVFVIVEDKMVVGKPVVEAVRQSSYVFVIGNISLKKMKQTAKSLGSKIKIISIKRTLKFSIL